MRSGRPTSVFFWTKSAGNILIFRLIGHLQAQPLNLPPLKQECGFWGQVLTLRHYPSLPWDRGLKEHPAGDFGVYPLSELNEGSPPMGFNQTLNEISKRQTWNGFFIRLQGFRRGI